MNTNNDCFVVTGASGHVGYHVAKLLLEQGRRTIIVVRSRGENVEKLLKLGAECRIADLRDRSTFADLLNENTVVFHLAAENTTDTDDEQRVIESTLTITREVVTACEQATVKTLVYTSSVVVLGRSRNQNKLIDLDCNNPAPESPYVKGKILAEQFIQSRVEAGVLDIRRVYPSWVVGSDNPKWTPPHQLIRDYLVKGMKFYFSGGISVADVEEVARAHVASYDKGSRNGRYLLGGCNVTFRQFYSSLAKLTGNKPPFIKLPKIAMLAAAHMIKTATTVTGVGKFIDPAYVKGVVGTYSWYDSSMAVSELGYRITDLEKSLTKALTEVRARMVGIEKLNALEVNGDKLPCKWLVTGVPGWLGNRFIEMLVERMNSGQITPAGICIYSEKRLAGLLKPGKNIQVKFGDICDGEALGNALEGIQYVCHIAGAIYPPKASVLYHVNTDGTKTLVDACIKKNVRRIIYIGTDAICGHGTKTARIFDENTQPTPYRHYGTSKYLGEKYVLDKTKEGLIDGTSIRAFWFFGAGAPPRQANFVNMFKWKRQIVFGNGRNFRSISTISNLSHAALLAIMEPATIGKWYWIGDEKPDYSVDEIYGMIAAHFGREFRPIHIPVFVCKCVNVLDWFMSKAGRIHPTIHAAGKFYFDIAGRIDAAKRDFGYKPVSTLTDEIAQL